MNTTGGALLPHRARSDVPPYKSIVALALFSFLLHFAWEILQAPLYADMAAAPHWTSTRICLLATIGDVGIALAAYVVTTGWRMTLQWRACRMRLTMYVVVGLAITVVLELLNVYVLHRWAYGTTMPVFLRMGLSPLLQWITVPLFALWLAQRHVAGARAATHDVAITRVPSDMPSTRQATTLASSRAAASNDGAG